MAFEQPEVYKNTPIPNGYWALHEANIEFPLNKITVRLALYYDAASWQQGNTDNAIAISAPYVIKDMDFATLFAPTNTIQQALYGAFVHVKSLVDEEGNPSYFANATIVP